MRRTKIKTLTLGLLMTLGGLTACNRVGDQYCDVGSDPDDPYDQCPYGGFADQVKYTPPPCPLLLSRTDCDPKAEPSWFGSIWPTLVSKGGCAGSGLCHDVGQSRGVKLTSDPQQSYDALTHYLGGRPTYYLGHEDSWIMCNLQSRDPAGGVTMPPGDQALHETSLETFNAVLRWAQCGQHFKNDTELGGNPG